MRKEQVNIYKFDELETEIKEKVLNEFRENIELDFLTEYLTDHLNKLLEKNNISIENNLIINYSLSYCQGDGLKFLGDFKYKKYSICIKDGYNSNYYSHKYTTDISMLNMQDIEDEILERDFKEFKELYYNICDELEKIAYSIIEDIQSDENIKETIKINEYEFYSDGRIF